MSTSDMNVMPDMSALQAAGPGSSTMNSIDAMRQMSMLTLNLQEQQTTFNSIMHAKVEGVKSLADVVKDGVQKGGYN
ncbi:hypothetical protein FSO04_44950 [Paraburkholderia madseniana]|uniref:Uncharacterized protein n=1 Tax=Paraburkholderia madseniana TaxID=2599607 RepID=A0A6N6VY00_9BURK|nr:hypothetical protein [Paraburkholderia madseniana]KAE8753482.1 hypothetical protein FSO04_44950 [Paraburkholderia madseniana]